MNETYQRLSHSKLDCKSGQAGFYSSLLIIAIARKCLTRRCFQVMALSTAHCSSFHFTLELATIWPQTQRIELMNVFVTRSHS